MVVVYSYSRFSTRPQGKGDSFRRQSSYAVQVCGRKDWTLDTTLTFADPGISAFKGLNATDGELARFLAAIKIGRVKPGQGLIVESLDRISRQTAYEAFKTIQLILDAEVFIHTVFDDKTYSLQSVKANPESLQFLLGVLTRAHDESKTKSIRAMDSWHERQDHAAERPVTAGKGHLPGWIRFNPITKELELIPERAALMREVIRLGITGMGPVAIVRKFNSEKIPSWSRKGKWEFTRLRKMMMDRTLIGEYQPTRGRIDFGEAIKNYYPAVCTEAEFYQLQAVIGMRKLATRGRRGPVVANLFGALAVSGDDKSVMRLNYKTTTTKRYISVDSLNGSAPFASFPYQIFEYCFLRHVSEIDVTETTPDFAEISELEGRLAVVRAKIDQTKAAGRTATGKTYDHILEMLPGLEEQEEDLMTRIEKAKAKAHRPAVSTSDVVALANALEDSLPEEKVIGRERLRGAIQGVVDRVEMYIRRKDKTAVLLVVVTLKDGLNRVFSIRKRGKDKAYSAGLPRAFSPMALDGRRMADLLIEKPDISDVDFAVWMLKSFLSSTRTPVKAVHDD